MFHAAYITKIHVYEEQSKKTININCIANKFQNCNWEDRVAEGERAR